MGACSGILSGPNSCTTVELWSPCLILNWRAIVGDFEDPPVYSDARVQDILAAAAYQVSSEVTCVNKPSINICTAEFSSNPFLFPSYINLVMLRAACLLNTGELRVRTLQEGIRAVAGPTSLEVKSGGSTYQILFTHGPCAAYKDLLDNLCFRSPIETAANCTQIVSTFVSDFYKEPCYSSYGEPCRTC